MQLDAIAVFAEVARLKSFTEAGRALNAPLSTVSRKVSELEASLDTRLIDRSKRQIRLTDAGSTYYDLCRKGLESLAHANRVMNDRHTDTAGTITVTMPPNLCEFVFLTAVETYQLRYPKARLRILVSERLLDLVDDNVDLSFRVAAPTQSDLISRTIMRHRHRLVATPGYAAVNALPTAPSDLADHRRIGFGFSSKREITWSLSKGTKTEDIRFEPDLAVNDYAAIKAAVLAGQGIAELPEPLCQDVLQTGHLIEVMPEWRFPEIKLFAVHAGSTSLPKLARLFLDIVVSNLKK